MLESHECVFCGAEIPLTNYSYDRKEFYFKSLSGIINTRNFDFLNNRMINSIPINKIPNNSIQIEMYRCPKCKMTQVILLGIGDDYKNDGDVETVNIFPRFVYKHFDNYVPVKIRKAYKEACGVIDVSPNASSTLSRKALEGIINDFYKINSKSLNLYQKIERLKKEDPSSIIVKNLDTIRKVGNIGTHFQLDTNEMPTDVDPEEAKALIKFIELVIEKTYIDKHDTDELLGEISELGEKYDKNKKQ